MTSASPSGSDDGPDIESRVREAAGAREDVLAVHFRDVNPKSVEVELEEDTDEGVRRNLYRVELEPRPGDEEASLHWVFLGGVNGEE